MKKKFLAMLLLAVLLAMSMAQVVWAGTSGHTRDEAVAWARNQATEWKGEQCVRLITLYYRYLGQTPLSGNGTDYQYNKLPAGWNRYTNTQATPQPGDIVVWGAYYKSAGNWIILQSGKEQYGHVGIVVATDSKYFYVVDYNGPGDGNKGPYKLPLKDFSCVIRPDWDSATPKPVDPLPSADVGNGFYAYIYNPASGLYVENVNQNAQLGSKKDGALGQLWYFSSSNDLSYQIINMADGSYLNVEGGKFAAHTNVNLTANPASNSISHKWYVCGKTNECYIASAYANGEDLVLDVFYGIGEAPIPLEGRNIWLCDNCYKNGEGFHAAETFQIIKVDAKNIPTNLGDDFYAGIGYLGAKTSYLTIDDEARSSGKTQYRKIETTQTLNFNDPRQIWHFVRNANGYYQVTNEFTGWSMYLRGGSAAAGQEVVSWGAQTNDNNQRWYILGSTKNGRYNLASAVNYPWVLGRNLFLLNVPVAKAGATAPDGTNTNIALQNADSSQFTIRTIAYNKPARPATPTGFTVSYDSNGISCKWNAVPVADKWDARYYHLALYKVAADGTETRLDVEQVGDVTNYTRAGALEPGNYIISIQALNKRYRSWA